MNSLDAALMRAPICRVCGMQHWGADHVWPRAATSRQQAAVQLAADPAPVPAVVAPAAEPVPGPGADAASAAAQDQPADPLRQAQPIDRRAYMAEYQRQRRARIRAEREACRSQIEQAGTGATDA